MQLLLLYILLLDVQARALATAPLTTTPASQALPTSMIVSTSKIPECGDVDDATLQSFTTKILVINAPSEEQVVATRTMLQALQM